MKRIAASLLVIVLLLGCAGAFADGNYSDENSVRGFVYRLYGTVFQRQPDEEGFNYWAARLSSGEITAADTVSFFFQSDEYKQSGKNNDQIVTDCYETMMNRAPDQEGYEFWTNRLDVGMTTQSVLAGFVYSDEFSKIAADCGIKRGDMTLSNPRDKNYERTYFVYRLYQNCLGRTPDWDGEEYWCDRLEHGATGTEAADGFFFSDEFNKKRYDKGAFVIRLYDTIHGRAYDTEGLVYWTNKLNYTDTRRSVMNGFTMSEEFRAQCEKADIKAGNPVPTQDSSFEWQYNIKVLELCNREREAAGLNDLYTREDLLWDVAMKRAKETTERFSHTRPDGRSCFTLFKEQGFYGHLGENLAAGSPFADPVEVVTAWMNSEGHRANILTKDYTYLATGYIYDAGANSYCDEGKYEGQYMQFENYAAQSFCNYGVPIN